MKSLSLFAVSTLLLGLALVGCEKHSFDDTKGLHLPHGKHHGEGHGDDHGKDAHAKDDHAKDDHAKDDHAKDDHAKEGKLEKESGAAPEAAKEEPRKTGL